VMKADLLEVIESYMGEESEEGSEARITLRNISEHVKEFD